jgi:DNA-binding response OmpR family regulator
MTNTRRLLLIDDDEFLRRSLVEQIDGREGIGEIVEAATGAEALAIATGAQAPFDLVLLDIGLPDMDGREVCRELRANGVRCPVIMLTAADSDDDTITGLGAGANDYVTKPFRLAVLMARVQAQIRQHQQSDDAVFAIGPYKFMPAAKMLQDEAAPRKIRLTEKETAILKYLFRMGRTIDRETLLNEVWGYNAGVSTHTLETHVYRLRQKIEPDPANAQLLVTEPGGYRLNP